MLIPDDRRRKRFTVLDGLILAAICIVSVYLVYRIRARLDYQWGWDTIGHYFFRRSESGGVVANVFVLGLLTTLRLSIWAVIFALVIGIIAAVTRLGRGAFLRFIGRTYVELIRNTPPLVLVFIFYFFVGNRIMSALRIEEFVDGAGPAATGTINILFANPARLPEFLSAVLTLGIYEGAYMAEIIRAGIQSVHKGQREAGYSLGLSRIDQYRYVILPQAFRNILPALAGQFISAIKDSAIVAVISIQELTFQGLQLMATTYRTIEIWITITLLYLVLTGACSILARRIEVRLSKRGA